MRVCSREEEEEEEGNIGVLRSRDVDADGVVSVGSPERNTRRRAEAALKTQRGFAIFADCMDGVWGWNGA